MRNETWLAVGLLVCLGATASAQTQTSSTPSSGFDLLGFFMKPFTTSDGQALPQPTQTRPTGFKLLDFFPTIPDFFSKPTMPQTTLPANTQFADPSFLRAWNANYPGKKPF
jgi:hypothetical protein